MERVPKKKVGKELFDGFLFFHLRGAKIERTKLVSNKIDQPNE